MTSKGFCEAIVKRCEVGKQILGKIVRFLDIILSWSFFIQFSLMIASFPIGTYVVYFSKLSSQGLDSTISLLPIFFAGIPFGFPMQVSPGHIFPVLWIIYLGFFLKALIGPKTSLTQGIRALIHGETGLLKGNSMFVVTASYSGLVVGMKIVRTLQGAFGIESGSPPASLPILDFASYSLSAVTEEVGYRMTIIGLGVAILGASRIGGSSLFKTLWHPAPLNPKERRIAKFLVLMGAIIFGFAHIAGRSWKVGKFSEAALAGYVAGWLYVLQGFQSPVLLHWSFNYFATSYEFLALAIESKIPVLVLESATYFVGVVAAAFWILGKLEKGRVYHKV